MSEPITRLATEHYDELIEFLNACFNPPGDDFPGILPGCYQPDPEKMRCNYAIRRDGRIAAVTGVFPIEWHIGTTTLRIAGIGGVSTAPKWRGQGLMNRLMRHVTHATRTDGYDLSFLGGQRQRYLYHGWERTGTVLKFDITRTNARHFFYGDAPVAVTLEPFDGEASVLEAIRPLHEGQLLHCARPGDRLCVQLGHWFNRPLLARDGASRIAGYMVSSADGREIVELVGRDDDTAVQIIRARLSLDDLNAIEVSLGPEAIGLAHRLAGFAEYTACVALANWRLFEWQKVIEALLAARHRLAPLPAGAVVLAIEGAPTLRLEVNADGATCVVTTEDADVTENAPTMMRALFGPLKPSTTLGALPESARILDAWCPLPLGIPRQDMV
ncbi:MAG: hypothetical protein CMJ18_16445 [Phycisphaeraceae bacterium]|nr:hypothetical protein [Phycisphaeraceae bacterium]